MPGKQTTENDLLMRSIKILDIGYITVIYVFIAIAAAYATDKLMGEFDAENEAKKSTTRLTLELVGVIWMYGVLIYIVRNLAELIPFPLDGYEGFEHKRVKELKSATVFTFTYIVFSDHIKQKMAFYYSKLSNKPSKKY
jgi:hypothetical protein